MSGADATIADAAERARVLDVTRSFVVQAPAGSGKTGLLVLRFLSLLQAVTRPEAVLAITFTRKAAGEMRRRILEALQHAERTTEPPAREFERQCWQYARAALEHDRQLGWKLLDSPSRLQVFTIDSLCSRIVGSTPLLSRLGSTPRVVDDAAPLYREAARRALSPDIRERLGERLEVLLERYEMGVERLEAQIADMLGRRDQWRGSVHASDRDESQWMDEIERSFADAIAAEVASIAAGAEPGLVARIHEIACRSRGAVGDASAWPTLGDGDRLGAGVENAYAWKQAAALLTKEDAKKLRTRSTKDCDVYGDDAGLRADFRDLVTDIADTGGERWLERLRAASRLPASPKFTADGRRALGAFLELLRVADGALWEVFRERGEVDHVEIAMQAVVALRPGETLERLDARVEHLLVDEYQDTNVLQCDLLRGLVSGWTPGDGRTMFLVGDPMQSIYRFRKAEVGLFLETRSEPGFLGSCALVPGALTVNFRSSRRVVGWVNDTFRILFGEKDDAARSLVAFSNAETAPDAGDGIDVSFRLWTGEDPDAKRADADAVEAAGLADWIADHLQQRRAEARDARPGEVPIAVLVRGRKHALPLLRALESRAPEVRVRAPGLDQLGDRQTALDLEALTRALLHPGDRLSWLALLRSPWVGLALGDLAALVEPDVAERGARAAAAIPLLLREPHTLSRLGEDARTRIERLLVVVEAARRDLASRPLDVALRSAWLRLGGPGSRPELPRQDALDAEAFFDLVARLARGGRVDLDELSRALADTEAPVDLDAEVDLEIMTMHKAKGLEFDTVILPALARSTGGSEYPPLAMETDSKTGLLTLLTPKGARGRDDADSDKYDFLRKREDQRRENELLRLLYVAATRTRRCLLLSAAAGRLNRNMGTPAGSLLRALEPAVSPLAAEQVMAGAGAPAPVRTPTRFPLAFRLAAPASVADRSVTTVTPSALGEQAPEFFAEGKLPAHIGTVYHAFVERIAASEIDAWTPARIAAERGAIVHALRSAGVLAAELEGAADRVCRALVATLEDEKGRWLLSSRDAARSEWAMAAWKSGRMISAKLDRSFVAGGVRWVVDFKTGSWKPPREAEAAAWATERCAQYAPQLASYRDLVRDAAGDGLPIRLALYFAEWPRGRRWHDITELAASAEKVLAPV